MSANLPIQTTYNHWQHNATALFQLLSCIYFSLLECACCRMCTLVIQYLHQSFQLDTKIAGCGSTQHPRQFCPPASDCTNVFILKSYLSRWLSGQINNEMKLLFILASLFAASHALFSVGAPPIISPGQKVNIEIIALPSTPAVSRAQYYVFRFCND